MTASWRLIIFLQSDKRDRGRFFARVVTPMAFVVSALMLTSVDNIAHEKKAAGR